MTDPREECAEYLKEGETPAERLASNHREILALMKLLEREKRHAEAWVKATRDAEAKLSQQGDQIAALQEQNRKLREAVREACVNIAWALPVDPSPVSSSRNHMAKAISDAIRALDLDEILKEGTNNETN